MSTAQRHARHVEGDTAQEGDTVRIDYTGRLQDGKVFGTSKGREPVEFVIGRGEILGALEDGLIGMSIGETKTITIPEERAFGPRKQDLIVAVGRISFQETTPEIGERYDIRMKDGRHMEGLVLWVDNDKVTMDANHPLAGKALTFDIELLEIGRCN
jgi:peptidylprolyl isomerase